MVLAVQDPRVGRSGNSRQDLISDVHDTFCSAWVRIRILSCRRSVPAIDAESRRLGLGVAFILDIPCDNDVMLADVIVPKASRQPNHVAVKLSEQV